MTEEMTNLVLEHLRAIRRDMARMENNTRVMQAEMTALRHQFSGVQVLQDNDHGEVADLKLRIDRIEQRLDLVD